ncbi:MAG: hypothetical protein ABI856_13935 [Nitrospira sp.]
MTPSPLRKTVRSGSSRSPSREGTIQYIRVLAEDRTVRVMLHAQPLTSVSGVAGRLTQSFVNLLDKALVHRA